MKKDMMKAFKLIRYGVMAKGTFLIMVIFFTAGTVLELMGFSVQMEGAQSGSGRYIGSVFILCSAMFPGQLLISTSLAGLVQTSSYKKRIQTSMLAKLNMFCNFTAVTWIVFLRLVYGLVYHEDMAEQMDSLLLTGLFVLLFNLFSIIVYKYFVASILIIVFFSMAIQVFDNWLSGGYAPAVFHLHPLLAVGFSYGMLIVGGILSYWISKAVYKKELTRAAFGAAAARQI